MQLLPASDRILQKYTFFYTGVAGTVAYGTRASCMKCYTALTFQTIHLSTQIMVEVDIAIYEQHRIIYQRKLRLHWVVEPAKAIAWKRCGVCIWAGLNLFQAVCQTHQHLLRPHFIPRFTLSIYLIFSSFVFSLFQYSSTIAAYLIASPPPTTATLCAVIRAPWVLVWCPLTGTLLLLDKTHWHRFSLLYSHSLDQCLLHTMYHAIVKYHPYRPITYCSRVKYS